MRESYTFEENYYALAIAILKPVTPEQAFELLDKGHLKKYVQYHYLSDDAEDMEKMRASGMTYKQIASIYGVNVDCVFRILKKNVGNYILSN